MSPAKILGILLILAGILGLVYGGFSYTEERHEADVGGLELSVEEKDRFNVPVWAGVLAVFAGAGLLVFGGRRS